MLVNGTNYGTPADRRGGQHAAAIRAAAEAGAARIVYTSWPDPGLYPLPLMAAPRSPAGRSRPRPAGRAPRPPVEYQPVSDDQFTAAAAAQGIPASLAGLLLDVNRAFRAGWTVPLHRCPRVMSSMH